MGAGCPSSETLERVALEGESDPQARNHFLTCSACREAIERIRANNAFLRSFIAAGVAPRRDASPAPLEFPGYEITGPPQRGGQGVVYEAIQLSTRRRVAIKVMREGPFATLADRARFEREIETLSRLDHPNIVAVHDAGVVAGAHYFVMDYVDGEALDVHVQNQRLNEYADRAPLVRLFMKVCDAVHAAHLRGVIHRDLKPSNIRVDRAGQPHVLDFGLAKAIDAETDSLMTRTGQFVGSLPWASPEQIEGAGSRIDLRTDVYSLGAIFYQLLTGAPPFEVGSNLRIALGNILEREPRRPSALATRAGLPHIDDELDTIVLKCLAKDRERRYQTAGELARDLGRYLAGEPILAKSDSAMYVLRKALRRYRLHVAAATGLVLLLGIFAVVMTLLYRRAATLEQQATRAAAALQASLTHSNIEQGRMAGLLGNIDLAESLLWRELLTVSSSEGKVLALRSPPGPSDAYWALWELYRRHPCERSIAFESAARTAALGADGASVWINSPAGVIERLGFSGDRLESRRLAAAGRTSARLGGNARYVSVVDADAHRIFRTDRLDDAPLVLPLPAASPGGPMLDVSSAHHVAAVVDDSVVVWEIDGGAELARFKTPAGQLCAVAVSPEGRRVAARDDRGRVFIWEVATGSRRDGTSASATADIKHIGGDLVFSPDGDLLADLWYEIAGRVWNLRSESLSATPLAVRAATYRIATFSPDSRWLAIGDANGVVRIYGSRTGECMSTFVAHTKRVRHLAFTRDGRALWTLGESELRRWEVPSDAGVEVIDYGADQLHSADLSADGRWLLAGGGGGVLHRLDRRSGEKFDVPQVGPATLSCVAIAPDGRRLAVASYSGAVTLWDAPDARQPSATLPHPSRVSFVGFSPDGSRVATGCDDGRLRIWSTATAALEHEFQIAADRLPAVAFDPEGRRVAVVVRSGALWVCDLSAASCACWAEAPPLVTPRRAVAFARDGSWLASAGAGRTIDVWDTQTRAPRVAMPGHNQEIYCLAISDDGALIASGDASGTIRLWDALAWRPLATLEGHSNGVMSLRFHRGEWRLTSASLDGTVRIWNLHYYGRHIAGNTQTQLRRLVPPGIPGTDAWLEWAERLGKASDPVAAN